VLTEHKLFTLLWAAGKSALKLNKMQKKKKHEKFFEEGPLYFFINDIQRYEPSSKNFYFSFYNIWASPTLQILNKVYSIVKIS